MVKINIDVEISNDITYCGKENQHVKIHIDRKFVKSKEEIKQIFKSITNRINEFLT